MRLRLSFVVACLWQLGSIFLHAQQYEWVTLAGNKGGAAVTDGSGEEVHFNTPSGIATNGAGTFYVSDREGHTIRRIAPDGRVTTLAGLAGTSGTANGTGSAARFFRPRALRLDAAGNLYVADTGNHAIRKVTPAGVVTTFAGMPGTSGSLNGTGTAARFNAPYGVALDAAGNVYVADTGNSIIRKITPAAVVATLAGTAGSGGGADGTGAAATFRSPEGVASDAGGTLYVADTGGHTIRKVTPAGVVTTFAGSYLNGGQLDGTGTAARVDQVCGIALDAGGVLWVADRIGTVRRITTPGAVVTSVGVQEN